MDYTKNHHLPQWVKSDRIMMDDFNQMCRDIEAGLNKNQSSVSGVENRLIERLSQTEKVIETLAPKNDMFNGLHRAAYNHLNLLAAVPAAHQLGAFIQRFGTSGGGSVSGMVQRADFAWMTHAPALLSLENTRSTIQLRHNLTTTTHSLEFYFTPPYYGILRSMRLLGTYNNPSSARDVEFRVRLKNNNVVVDERRMVRMMSSGQGTLRETVNNVARDGYTMGLDMLVHSGVTYLVEVMLDTLSIQPNFTINPNGEECMVFTGVNTASASIQRTISTGEARPGGLALVHYGTWAAGGAPSLVWDGVSMPSASVIRTIGSRNGLPLLEAEFRRSTEAPANSTIRLTMSCNSGGDVSLYDWGAVLL